MLLASVDGAAEAAEVPGVERVHLTAAPGRPVRAPQNAYDRLGYVIAEGSLPENIMSLDEAGRLLTVRLEGA